MYLKETAHLVLKKIKKVSGFYLYKLMLEHTMVGKNCTCFKSYDIRYVVVSYFIWRLNLVITWLIKRFSYFSRNFMNLGKLML